MKHFLICKLYPAALILALLFSLSVFQNINYSNSLEFFSICVDDSKPKYDWPLDEF